MKAARVLGAAGVVAALAIVAVYAAQAIPPIDLPWHLATGRLIVEKGIVPVTNTLSWTFPDHPLPQQYPLYQAAAYILLRDYGWGALSAANLLLWLSAALAWLRWAGSPKELAEQPLLVFLVCLGIQRHLLVRPEVCTLLGLGVVLVFLDAYRAGARSAMVGVVATQWLMAQTHQLWVLGFAVQLLFLVHLAVARSPWAARLGLTVEDCAVPVGPPVAAVVGSVAVLCVSPLGIRTFLAPLAPLLTLWTQGAGAEGGAQAQELALVWSDPLATTVVVAGVVAAGVALVRSRGRWSLLDLGVFAMGLALVVVAVRGIPFFAVATGGLVARTRARVGPLLPAAGLPLRLTSGAAAVVLAGTVIVPGLRAEPRYTSTQLGFGRSVGDWGDGLAEALDRIRPGRVLNLGWVAGNPLAYGGFPVFVDPRFEAYPKPFLLEAIAAETDAAALRGLLDTWKPDAVVVELRKPSIVDRAAELVAEGWAFAYVDALFGVLIPPPTVGTDARAIDPATATTGTDAPEGSVLRAQEHLRLARLLLRLGRADAAEPHVAQARSRADDAAVADELAELSR